MPWWGWLIVGAVLLGAEVLVSTEFYLAIFGVAALLVGLVMFAGLDGPAWAQWLSFGVLAIALLIFFRRKIWGLITPGPESSDETLVGDVAVTVEEIGPGAEGGGELRGTVWKMKNAGAGKLGRGARVRVVAVEGVLLHVEPE